MLSATKQAISIEPGYIFLVVFLFNHKILEAKSNKKYLKHSSLPELLKIKHWRQIKAKNVVNYYVGIKQHATFSAKFPFSERATGKQSRSN